MSHFLSQYFQPGDAHFVLKLNDSTSLTCHQIVRVVPHKRIVCQAMWNGKSVYSKLFFGTNAVKYAARDAMGVRCLANANIDTPRLLYQGESLENHVQVLIFEAIECLNNSTYKAGSNIEQVLPTLRQSQRLAIAKKIILEVAKHHNAGLLQTDLYLKNFLVSKDRIYTLDGDGIRKFNHLNRRKALHNLALICSKFDVMDIEKWQTILAETYSNARGCKSILQPNLLGNMANEYRLQAASNYADHKVFRQCSDVNVITAGDLYIAASSDFDAETLINPLTLDTLIQPDNLLKNGHTCTVALAEINNKEIVIKRYNIKNFWHAASRAFRPSRAAASWANAHRLNILEIPTAKPVALIEQRNPKFLFGGIRGKAYFLAEYLNLPDVKQYFVQTQGKVQRAEAIKNITIVFYKLFLLQISHGDTKATNIKMQDTQPIFIDLDSMRQHRNVNLAAHARDLQRFMQNWQDNTSLYNAFVNAFKVTYSNNSVLIKAGIATN